MANADCENRSGTPSELIPGWNLGKQFLSFFVCARQESVGGGSEVRGFDMHG